MRLEEDDKVTSVSLVSHTETEDEGIDTEELKVATS
jgi:hypothetical protein